MKKKKPIKNLKFQLEKSPEQYKRDGKNVYLCAARKMFVPASEEERVRQAFIVFLRDKVGLSEEMLCVEESMSHYKRGKKGRADIIGLTCHAREPLFVVECKKSRVPLTQNVFDQAKIYADCSGCDIVILTNGIESEVHIRENKQWLKARGILTYKEMTKIGNYDYKKPNEKPWQRPEYKDLARAIKDGKFDSRVGKDGHRDYGCFGKDSPEENLPFFANLVGLLRDETKSLKLPIINNNFEISKDLKLRYSSFGNAAGGGYTSYYRSFIIKDKNDENQIISVSITGTLSRKNDPKFGNRRGNTQLNVAIDDYEKRHHSLQLDMDKFVKISGRQASIWHNGRMTVGNLGSVKRHLVLEYVRKKAPYLLENNIILLANLPTNRLITWRDAKTFLINCIEYALLRDEFREIYSKKALQTASYR